MRKSNLMAAALLLLAGAGCSDHSAVDVSMSSTELHTVPGMASGAQLEVTVNEVAIHSVSGGAAEPADDDAADGGAWVTVFSGAQVLDLAQIDATRAFLGSAIVPAGRVTQVRLVLAPDPRIVIGGAPAPVACPSCDETGLKIVPHGTLTVPEGGTLDLELVIEADASLAHDSLGWHLDPVVRL